MNDFYIGYVPRAPESIARLLRIVASAFLLAVVGSAITISLLQNPFADSAFEYGHPRTFEGVLRSSPYPTLVVRRPGTAESGSSQYLLVGEGKHGAGQLVIPYDGQAVRLKGMLIYRDGRTMLEVLSGSIEPKPAPQEAQPVPPMSLSLGEVDVIGEIVDSKCYFGVMNPGSGKVHLDCAVRCLSGGIPPSFVVPDFRGREATFLLTDPAGRSLTLSDFRGLVARPLRIRGTASRLDNSFFLAVDPSGMMLAK